MIDSFKLLISSSNFILSKLAKLSQLLIQTFCNRLGGKTVRFLSYLTDKTLRKLISKSISVIPVVDGNYINILTVFFYLQRASTTKRRRITGNAITRRYDNSIIIV